jgi:hypothetical protein
MNADQIKQIRSQLVEIAKSYNGYNGEVVLRGIQTRIEMTEYLQDPVVKEHPQTGFVTQKEAERLAFIATKIFRGQNNEQTN